MPGTSRVRDPALEEEFIASLVKGKELLEGGKLEEATAWLEKAHALQPKDEKARNLLGLAYFKTGKLDQASQVYEKLVLDNPIDPTLRVNLGLVFLKSGDLQGCIREFEAATDLDPDHKKAHNYLGLALAQNAELERAKHHFELAGSDAMVEKMTRAIAARNEKTAAPPVAPVAAVAPPAPPPPPSSPQPEAIEVMSDALPPEAVEEPPTPSALSRVASGDWGAQVDGTPSPVAEQNPMAPEPPTAAPFNVVLPSNSSGWLENGESVNGRPVESTADSYDSLPVVDAQIDAMPAQTEEMAFDSPIPQPVPTAPGGAWSAPSKAITVEMPAAVAEQSWAESVPAPVEPVAPGPGEDGWDPPAEAFAGVAPEVQPAAGTDMVAHSENEGEPASYSESRTIHWGNATQSPMYDGAPVPTEAEQQPAPADEGWDPPAEAFAGVVPGQTELPAEAEAPHEAAPPAEQQQSWSDGAPATTSSDEGWVSQPASEALNGPPPSRPAEPPSAPSTQSAAPALPSAGYAPMASRRLTDLGASSQLVSDAGSGPFHVSADGLAVTVAGEMLVRMSGLVAVVGSVDAVPERKKSRGRSIEQPFGQGATQMQRVTGQGVLYLETGRATFHSIDVDDEGVYLREERIFAFEESIAFENGRLTGDHGVALDLVNLKGAGRALVQLEGTLKAMPIPAGAPMLVPLNRLVGWFGYVTPRVVAFAAQGAVELTGEGFALLGAPAERG